MSHSTPVSPFLFVLDHNLNYAKCLLGESVESKTDSATCFVLMYIKNQDTLINWYLNSWFIKIMES